MITVPELILAQAKRSPEAVAVESASERISYAQMAAKASGLADHLRRLGVGPADIVAVAVPRSAEMVPALLGVQLSGAAYLPLDHEHPAERQNYILADAGARFLVTAGASGEAGLSIARRVRLDDVPAQPGLGQPITIRSESAAYVIYTSGSTGQPKGVMVTHRALANLVCSIRELLNLPADTVLPAVTTVSFDIAALELFVPLTTGGRVVVGLPGETTDPKRLAGLLARTSARVMQATPATWRLLLEAGWSPPPGFTVLCGGERLPAELAERLTGDGVVLWDLYGPTETTIWSAATRYEHAMPVKFDAVRNTSLHLLGERLEPVPAGAEGEVYIGGTGLATCYLGRPALTAGRFVADPFATAPGARFYRTGDIARWHPDGRIEILGRSDDQIKIRGFRVEPGEIEGQLLRHPDVVEAAVRAINDAAGSLRLVGYIRPADPSHPPDDQRLRLHLTRLLPAYMIPAQFVILSAFPRTPNGKLDRSALPAPASGDAPPPTPHGPYPGGVPSTETERRVAAIAARMLERQDIGMDEDFFSLGGDSLLAVQAVNLLNEELKTEIPVNALFEVRTLANLARMIDGDVPEPELRPLPASQTWRISSGQWRLWLHQCLVPHSTAYNEPLAVPLPGALDISALEIAVKGLLARHEILRTRYDRDDSGQPVAVLMPVPDVRLELEDGDPRTVLAAELARPFNLATQPPIRFRLVRGDDGNCVLLVVLHHIATDDRSHQLIFDQVLAAYRGRPVAAPQFRYADYAHWQREMLASPAARQHLDYWRRTLANLRPADLLGDQPRPAHSDWHAGTVRFTVASSVVSTLRDLSHEHDATAFIGLLAGFFGVLARHVTGTDLTVGIPITLRDRPELEDLVGMLVNTVVIRIDVEDTPTFGQLLQRVRDAAFEAYDHAVTPFEEIAAAAVDAATGPGSPYRNPVFDAVFVAHGPVAAPAGFPLPEAPGAKFDLLCELTERADGGLDGRIEYATQLFARATVTGFADSFVQLLTAAGKDPALRLEKPGGRSAATSSCRVAS
jgi:amino acid adenylation domain-containing protein